MLAAAGANMIDDAVFMMMDIANGLDAGDALQGFAKKGLVSVATSFIGAKFNGVLKVADKTSTVTGGLAQTLNVGDSVMRSTLLKGAEIMTSNIASSAINALDFEAMFKGKDFFNEKAFNEGAFGEGAMAGVVAGMAGNFVSGSFSSAMKSQSFAGFASRYTDGVKNLGATLGGLASTGVTYGMTGNATVNLLNMSMFSNKLNTGLFELSFGEDGVRGAIGMGGTDLNVGKLVSSLNGMNALYQNGRINEIAAKSKQESNVALRALYSYGDKAGRETYRDILRGDTKLAVDENLENNAKAKTVDNGDGTKTIFLTSLSNNVNAGVNAGIVLQHEAYRDGVESGDQKAETRSAVQGHTEMAIRVRDDKMYVNAITYNQNLTNDIAAYESGSAAFDAYANTEYDSSADYWLYTNNGDLIDDGKNSVWTEDGLNVFNMEDLTREEQIAKMTGNWDTAKNEIKDKEISKIMLINFDVSGDKILYTANDLSNVYIPSSVDLRVNLSLYEILKPLKVDQNGFNNALVNRMLYPDRDNDYSQNYLYLSDDHRPTNDKQQGVLSRERAFYQKETNANADFGEWLIHSSEQYLKENNARDGLGLPHDQIKNDRIAYGSWMAKGNLDGLYKIQKHVDKSMNTGVGAVYGNGVPEVLDVLAAGASAYFYDTRRVLGITRYQIEWNFLQTRGTFDWQNQWKTQGPVQAYNDKWYRDYIKRQSTNE